MVITYIHTLCTYIGGGSVADEHSEKSYLKSRAYLTSSFVLDAITL